MILIGNQSNKPTTFSPQRFTRLNTDPILLTEFILTIDAQRSGMFRVYDHRQSVNI